MEIRESATYPYPIWGLHDSFIGDSPVKGTREMSSNNETNTLEIKYSVLAHNSGIDRLIMEGLAKYECIVECPQTYYIHKEISDSPEFVIHIPYDSVYNRVSVKVFVVATAEITNCTYLEVDEVYEGIVDYPKGAVVAYLDEFVIPFQQSNNTSDLSKIIRIMPTDVKTVQYVFATNRILIKIPQALANGYDKVVRDCPGVIESSLVFNALVQAVFNLREESDDTKDWVFYLRQYIKECQDAEIITNDVNDYNFSIDEVYTIVERLLDHPQLSAITETEKVIDQQN